MPRLVSNGHEQPLEYSHVTQREGEIANAECARKRGEEWTRRGGTHEHEAPASFWQIAGVAGPTEAEKKSRHRQSFWQQSFPWPKGIAQVNPFMQRVSLGLLKSRVCPLQSLSELHAMVQ